MEKLNRFKDKEQWDTDGSKGFSWEWQRPLSWLHLLGQEHTQSPVQRIAQFREVFPHGYRNRLRRRIWVNFTVKSHKREGMEKRTLKKVSAEGLEPRSWKLQALLEESTQLLVWIKMFEDGFKDQISQTNQTCSSFRRVALLEWGILWENRLSE